MRNGEEKYDGLTVYEEKEWKGQVYPEKLKFFSPGNFGASAVNKGIQREKLIRNCDPKASCFGHVQYLIMKKYDNSWAPLIWPKLWKLFAANIETSWNLIIQIWPGKWGRMGTLTKKHRFYEQIHWGDGDAKLTSKMWPFDPWSRFVLV